MTRGWFEALAVSGALAACLLAACDDVRSVAEPVASAAPQSASPGAPSSRAVPGASPSATAASSPGATDGGASAGSDDPMALHLETREALIAFVEIAPSRKRRDDPMFFLERTFGVGTPGRVSQGNKDIARHERSRAVCLAGLEGVVIQTEEQRRICGADNMVPVHRAGDPSTARFCIDVFEFPNRACELPVVWSAPIQAKEICALEGKRLCQQEEWMLSCRADPGGGADRVYAYGDELDLEVCNTNKRAREGAPACDPKTARSAFETCATDTEPSGSFPGCRSRFGVFDQHGNVAEIMTRLDADGHVYTQLKGSAFFYRKVARTMKERPKKETYPDHCGHDPRWHVEPIERGWHVNYHLGFRCCKSL